MNTKKNDVAIKYNGNLLDNCRNTSNFDYLVVNLKGVINLEKLPHNVKIKHSDYGTRVFKNVATVYISGIKSFGIVYNSRNKNIDSKLVQLKIENHLLYTMPLEQIKLMIQSFAKYSDLVILGLSRLDVAIDFENSTNEFTSLIKGVVNEDFVFSGRTKKVSFFNEFNSMYATTQKGVLVFNGFSVGKRSSSRFLRIYNKSLEMEQVKFKHHIKSFWKSSGFSDFSNIWRFEYSLNSTFLKQYAVKFDDVFKGDFLIKILKCAYNSHFDIKINTNKTEVNKEKSLSLFCFDAIKKSSSVLKKVSKVVLDTIQRSVVSVKRQVKGMYRNYFSTNCGFHYDALFDLLERYDIKEWFWERQDSYLKEFNKKSIILSNLI